LGIGNHSYLSTILRLDREYERISSQLRGAFLKWSNGFYEPKEGTVFKSDETSILISLIYGSNAYLKYKGNIEHIQKIPKVPQYMQFFFTQYPHIATSPIVSSAAFVVTAVEGIENEPESCVQISLRVPRDKKYSNPLGLIAEGVANYFKKEYGTTSVDVQGGGHPTAAGIRIKQELFSRFMKDNNLDKFDAIEEIIKRSEF